MAAPVPELRIVAGEWRGRRIAVPDGTVRPTADKVREAWMSIVRPALDLARVVDLCAGTGALGLEALSRGASHCDFVDESATVLITLRKNIAALGAGDRATVHRGEAVGFIESVLPVAGQGPSVDASADVAAAKRPWDVAFADPPYGQGIALALAERWLRAPFATIFGVEHEAGLTLPPGPGGAATDRRAYGITAITFYRTGR